MIVEFFLKIPSFYHCFGILFNYFLFIKHYANCVLPLLTIILLFENILWLKQIVLVPIRQNTSLELLRKMLSFASVINHSTEHSINGLRKYCGTCRKQFIICVNAFGIERRNRRTENIWEISLKKTTQQQKTTISKKVR